jgi:hypothetical protein
MLFRRADSNADGFIELADAVNTLLYLFHGGQSPGCLKSADSNDDGTVNTADALYLLSYLFADAAPPAAPFGTCGIDPTADGLSCGFHAPCGPLIPPITHHVTTPNSIAAGEPFSVEVRTTNIGTDAERGWISVSFPDITTNGGEADIVDDGSDMVPLLYGPYEPDGRDVVWAHGQPVGAQYMLADMEVPGWTAGQAVSMRLIVVPTSAGTYRVNVRSVLKRGTAVFADPAASGVTDAQQDVPVYQHVVTVNP